MLAASSRKMSAAEQELALTEAALNQDQPQLNHVQLALRVIFMGLWAVH